MDPFLPEEDNPMQLVTEAPRKHSMGTCYVDCKEVAKAIQDAAVETWSVSRPTGCQGK